ncbi:MAG: hypothetical protein AAF702_22145 [Chloroflexota bacterium]
MFSKLIQTLIILCAVITGVATIKIRSATACSCVSGRPFIEQVTNAAAIFSGKVIDEGTLLTETESNGRIEAYKVQVAQVWKGPRTVTITVARGNSNCSYRLLVGQEYLIFAYEYENQLYAGGLCSYTQPLETAWRTRELLNQIYESKPVMDISAPAQLTVHGPTGYSIRSNLIRVRYTYEKIQLEERLSDEKQQIIKDILISQGLTQQMLSSSRYSSSHNQILFAISEEHWPDGDVNSLLNMLIEIQHALEDSSLNLPIDSLEAMFTVDDCTRLIVRSKRYALTQIQQQAEVLTGLTGSTLGKVISIVDSSTRTDSANQQSHLCRADREWHKLPLQADLQTVMLVDGPLRLSVTFEVQPLDKTIVDTESSINLLPFNSPLASPDSP